MTYLTTFDKKIILRESKSDMLCLIKNFLLIKILFSFGKTFFGTVEGNDKLNKECTMKDIGLT